jgi:hypothetical protein
MILYLSCYLSIYLFNLSLYLSIYLLDHGVSSANATDPGFNIYRNLMSKIIEPKELYFLLKGFTRLLSYIYKSKQDSASSYITNEAELLILLWKCMEEIPAFLPYILDNCDITELLIPLMYVFILLFVYYYVWFIIIFILIYFN